MVYARAWEEKSERARPLKCFPVSTVGWGVKKVTPIPTPGSAQGLVPLVLTVT